MHEPPRHLVRRRPRETSGGDGPHQRVTLLLSAVLVAAVLAAGGVAVLTGAAGVGRTSVADRRLDQSIGGPAVATLPPGVVGAGTGGAPGPSTTAVDAGGLTGTSAPAGGGSPGGTAAGDVPPPGGGPADPNPAPEVVPVRVPTSTKPSERPGSPSRTAPTTPPDTGETTTTQAQPTKSSGPGLDRHGA